MLGLFRFIFPTRRAKKTHAREKKKKETREDSVVDNSAARSLNLFFDNDSHFSLCSRESFVKKRDEKEENINTPTKRKEHVGQLPRAQAEAEELLERLAAGAAPDREEINAVFFSFHHRDVQLNHKTA